MDPRGKIPALALLGLQFTAGCGADDPIVGTWEATQIGSQMFPIEMREGEFYYLVEIELRIGEDFQGSYWQQFTAEAPGPDYYEAQELELVVVPDGAKYRIEIQQPPVEIYDGYGPPELMEVDPLVLDCEIAGEQMRCSDGAEPEREYRWRRKG